MICLSRSDEKGSRRVRAPGELILKLFGQMDSKKISLPPIVAAVLAAAAAAAHAYVACMYMHLIASSPILTHSDCPHAALALRTHRPWPVCTRLPRPRRRTGCCAAAAVRSCVC